MFKKNLSHSSNTAWHLLVRTLMIFPLVFIFFSCILITTNTLVQPQAYSACGRTNVVYARVFVATDVTRRFLCRNLSVAQEAFLTSPHWVFNRRSLAKETPTYRTLCFQPFPVWCCIWYTGIWLVFWLLRPWGVCICLDVTPSDFSGSTPRVYWGPLGGIQHLWVRLRLYKWWYHDHQQTMLCLSWCWYQITTNVGNEQQIQDGAQDRALGYPKGDWDAVRGGALTNHSLRAISQEVLEPVKLRFLPCTTYHICWALWGAATHPPTTPPFVTLSKALLKSITMQSICLWAENIVGGHLDLSD